MVGLEPIFSEVKGKVLTLLKRKKRPKPEFDAHNPKSWSPLVKVLAKWKLGGHTGLTIHALATLLKQEPEVLLKEISKNQYVYGQYCYSVKATVWCVSLEDSSDSLFLRTRRIGDAKATVLAKAREELKKWPWPDTKGVMHGEADTEHTGLEYAPRVFRRLAEDGPLKLTSKDREWLS